MPELGVNVRAVVRTEDKKLTRSILDVDTLLVAAGIRSTNSQNLDLAADSNIIAVKAGNTFNGESTAAFDWSGSTGIFKTPTGVATFGGSSNAFTNNVDFSGGVDVLGGDLIVTSGTVFTQDIRVTSIDDFVSTANAGINFGGANKTITFETDATNRMRIDSVGNVGIGTTTPDTLLHVASGTLAVPAVDGRRFVISDPTLAAMSLVSGATGEAHVNFGDPSDIDIGRIIYRFSTNQLGFGTNATSDHMIIDADGNVGIGTVTPGAKLDVSGDLVVNGNLTVEGTRFITDSETVQIADNFILLNDGYTADAPQRAGLIMNIDPTTTTDTVAVGGFTAGGSGVDATVVMTTGAVFALADLVLIAGSTSNDGIYEVVSHGSAPNTLTVRTTGGATAPVEDWTQSNFTTEAGAGTITKIGVVVVAAGTDGILESATGNVTPLSFTDLALVTDTTLQTAYDNDVDGSGATITTNSTDGAVVIAGDQKLQITATLGLDVDAVADFSGGVTNSGGEHLFTSGNLQLNDGIVASFGTDDDLTMSHSGSAGAITNGTGNLVIDNTSGTGATIIRMGTNSSATVFEVQSDSESGKFSVNGAGDVVVSASGTFSTPSGTSFKIDGVALTSVNFTAVHLSTLLDGALHTDGWTTTGVSVGEVAAISANDTVVKADATSGGNANVEGIVNLAGEVQQSGKVVGAQFVTGLTLTVGQRIFLSKTAGALTNDVSGFAVGDVIQPMGRVRDTTGYTGADIPNSKATISLIQGEPGEA